MSPAGRYSLLGLTILAAAVCSGLGIWQLDRLAGRRAANARALAQRDLPVLDLNRESPPPELTFRRATVHGTWDFGREFLLRGRLVLGTPGVQIITPLRVAGRDTVLLVNRGFVPTPDAGPPPPGLAFAEPPEATLHGVVLPVPDEGDGRPLDSRLGESWGRLDLTAMRRRLPYPVAPWYLIVEAAPGTADHTPRGTVLPVRVEPPPLDDGPHLSYAVQWFLIAAAALGFGIVFVLRGGTGRSGAGGPDA
jgi:surfeit locus 1 family protein